MGVVLFGAYVLYQVVKTWIDGKIEEEEPGLGAGESEDGMGPGSSRLATLLPLFRNVLLITIVAIAGMVVLSGMGVDVGPLFAGAGVVGLAVGFGSQALIRDIFSGAFFLIDDAFRRGEYISVGSVMGSVEKISMRSFQLRHHNGPLHTVPFGEIKQLTNFSRDWVIMKLPLRLAYGTDIERVRKLVKKLGEELQQDPEIGPMFLQPLKSQGVIQMEDSAMILRGKFMTRPGDQFVTRRHVYTRIHDMFAREGIHFAHREVTVRIADEEDGLPPAEAEERRRTAALGAARAILDDEAGAKKLATTGPGS
jgi:small-conductance mechanosensitive channel